MLDRVLKYERAIIEMKVDHYFGINHDRWEMRAMTDNGPLYSEDAQLIKAIMAIKIGKQNIGNGI